MISLCSAGPPQARAIEPGHAVNSVSKTTTSAGGLAMDLAAIAKRQVRSHGSPLGARVAFGGKPTHEADANVICD
jgi:hypothetical protein